MMDGVRTIWRQAVSRAVAAAKWLLQEARQVLDVDAFRCANDWRGRLDAVSWRRAAVAGGGVMAIGLAVGLGFWLAQPEFGGRPPRLPTEQEWRANQAAGRAMEGELSPALAKANASVTP